MDSQLGQQDIPWVEEEVTSHDLDIEAVASAVALTLGYPPVGIVGTVGTFVDTK